LQIQIVIQNKTPTPLDNKDGDNDDGDNKDGDNKDGDNDDDEVFRPNTVF